MSAIARLEVIPQTEASMADAVARAVEALDQFDVSYETTPTDTIIEAEDPTEVFAAAEAAHRAVESDRVVTSLEIDDLRTRSQRGRDRVEAVERRLGRPARRRRETAQSERRRGQQQQAGQAQPTAGQTRGQTRQAGQPQQTGHPQSAGQQQTAGNRQTGEREQPQRYGGPWRSEERTSVNREGSRYLQSRHSSP